MQLAALIQRLGQLGRKPAQTDAQDDPFARRLLRIQRASAKAAAATVFKSQSSPQQA